MNNVASVDFARLQLITTLTARRSSRSQLYGTGLVDLPRIAITAATIYAGSHAEYGHHGRLPPYFCRHGLPVASPFGHREYITATLLPVRQYADSRFVSMNRHFSITHAYLVCRLRRYVSTLRLSHRVCRH